MLKYRQGEAMIYAVYVNDIEYCDIHEWYEHMEALGFDFSGHNRLCTFDDVYFMFFNSDSKEILDYFCDEDREFDEDEGEFIYSSDFEGAVDWYKNYQDWSAQIEDFDWREASTDKLKLN